MALRNLGQRDPEPRPVGDPVRQARFPEQPERRQPAVAFEHGEAFAFRQDDERLDVQIAIGCDRLEQLAEVFRAIELGDDVRFGRAAVHGHQARILTVQNEPLHRHGRDGLQGNRGRRFGGGAHRRNPCGR